LGATPEWVKGLASDEAGAYMDMIQDRRAAEKKALEGK